MGTVRANSEESESQKAIGEKMNIPTKEEILKAKAEAVEAYEKGALVAYTSKVVGEPVDPLKPYAPVIDAVADSDTVPAGDDYLSFDVDEDTKYVYLIDNTGHVTTQQITVGAPTGATFYNAITRQEKINLVDLLTARYDVIGKKRAAVIRSLDAIEIQKVVALLNSATPAGNRVVLASGETKFQITHLLAMKNLIQNYAGKFVLVLGSQCAADMERWDYDEDKYHAIADMVKAMNVESIRVFGAVTIDGAATNLIHTNKAYLVGIDGVTGKPLNVGRRILPDKFAILGGEKDAQKQRTTIITPALMNDGANTDPAMGVSGFESFAAVCKNTKVLAAFYRASVWA